MGISPNRRSVDATARARLLLPLATLLLAAAFSGAQAANNFSKAAFQSAKDDIQATYKTERAACKNVAGNAKDICEEEVEGREKVALAQLQFNYTGDSKDEINVYAVWADARHAVAKEKCDDLAGQPRALCQREAKTAHEKAQADIKLTKKVNSAFGDAESARMKSDYKLASERCAALAGDAKDACVASAKARFNERW